MSERLAVDSLMTADGEVVQLPTLGPLGPVDAEGGRIPLDTVRLFDAEGRLLKVESYEFSTWSQRWVVHLGSGRDAYADDCYLSRPDSFEMKLEHGRFVFVEVKSCMADFKSGHGLTFRGDDNWLVCPRDLADELHDKMLLPLGVQVYCPDNGGSLRLRYDLSMRGAGSLREDSTLCLLWAMLMDSYTRWRTTGGVFVEASD